MIHVNAEAVRSTRSVVVRKYIVIEKIYSFPLISLSVLIYFGI